VVFLSALISLAQRTCSIIIVGGERAAGRLRPQTHVGRRRAPARCRRRRGVTTCTRCGGRVVRRRMKVVPSHTQSPPRQALADWLTGRRRRPAVDPFNGLFISYFIPLKGVQKTKKSEIRSRIFI
jgi:hypothetical protein